MEPLIFLGLAILIVVILVFAGVKVVPQSETRVIERLGRFQGNNLLPLLVDLQEHVLRQVGRQLVVPRVMLHEGIHCRVKFLEESLEILV